MTKESESKECESESCNRSCVWICFRMLAAIIVSDFLDRKKVGLSLRLKLNRVCTRWAENGGPVPDDRASRRKGRLPVALLEEGSLLSCHYCCGRSVAEVLRCYRKEASCLDAADAAPYRLRFTGRFPVHTMFASFFCGLDLNVWSFTGERCATQTCDLEAAAACLAFDDITDTSVALSEGAR